MDTTLRMGKTRSVVEGLREPRPSEGVKAKPWRGPWRGGVRRCASSADPQEALPRVCELAAGWTSWSGEGDGGSSWGEYVGG